MEKADQGPETAPPKPTTSPLQLAAVGVVSLLVCGLVGWRMRGSREATTLQARASDAKNPASAVTSPDHRRGQLVFRIHCARCHGQDGHGDGPDAATLRPPPRDLTATAWRTPPTRESIRKTIVEGLPNSMMPGLGPALSTSELASVVEYVLSIAPRFSEITPLLKRAGFTPTLSRKLAPGISILGEDGRRITLDRFRGQTLLLVFWGTRCAPCLKELPDLQTLAEEYANKSLAVIPICADETEVELVRSVAKERAPKLPVLIDTTGEAKRLYDVQTLPMAILIDAEGRILGQTIGAMEWQTPDMKSLLNACLSQGNHPGLGKNSNSQPK